MVCHWAAFSGGAGHALGPVMRLLHPLCKQELLARHGYVCLDCSPNWVPKPVGSAKARADWRGGAADMPFAQRIADLLSRGTCIKGVNRCWTDVVCRPNPK
jgi:hypothetical protein|tara:strand:- start:133 stop:435 length:303 start_codon:yes stop_codon:yes gene_type:complete